MRSVRHAFSSCTFTTLGLRGFGPVAPDGPALPPLGCGSLTTILADPSWALPSNGINGMQYFYNCKKLVGGNGTAW